MAPGVNLTHTTILTPPLASPGAPSLLGSSANGTTKCYPEDLPLLLVAEGEGGQSIASIEGAAEYIHVCACVHLTEMFVFIFPFHKLQFLMPSRYPFGSSIGRDIKNSTVLFPAGSCYLLPKEITDNAFVP